MSTTTPYALISLADVLAQTVHFATAEFEDNGVVPKTVAWNIAYICSCFLAQHTLMGHEGVESACCFEGLKVDQFLPYEERLELAKALVNHWSKADDC